MSMCFCLLCDGMDLQFGILVIGFYKPVVKL